MRFLIGAGIALAALAIAAAPALPGQAFAQDAGMSVRADAAPGSSFMLVSGQTAISLGDVTVRVTGPGGNIVHVAQVTPAADGTYMVDVRVGPLWSQDGEYTVSASQAPSDRYRVSTAVTVAGGLVTDAGVPGSSMQFDSRPLAMQDGRESGLRMEVDAPVGTATVGIGGTTDHTGTDVTITVEAPNGNVIAVDQATPGADGAFSAEMAVGCPTWKQDGFYTITARQGTNNAYSDTATVEIGDCVVVPEFGAVAVLALAAAVVAAVAITARSRPGLVAGI